MRKYAHNPEKILGYYVKPGMKVMDFWCALGYFSIPMAKMVGESGKVYCTDVQEKMLNKLKQRAEKAGVTEIIEPVLINNESNILDEMNEVLDFCLLFAVLHEVPDKEKLFTTLHKIMRKKSLLLFAEPSGHVSLMDFKQSVSLADKAGFNPLYPVNIKRSHSMVLEKR